MRYFAAVAETLSFTAAARRLRVSQPPVTRQSALLEEEVGLQLLRRTKRHVPNTRFEFPSHHHPEASSCGLSPVIRSWFS